MAKAWLIKAIKQPLVSILLDQTLNLDIVDPRLDSFELQNRVMKADILLKAIFKGIIEHTSEQSMSTTLIGFLG